MINKITALRVEPHVGAGIHICYFKIRCLNCKNTVRIGMLTIQTIPDAITVFSFLLVCITFKKKSNEEKRNVNPDAVFLAENC